MYKRILVPLDGSQFAEAALPQAKMLAACSGGEIELLRVAVHPSHYSYVSDTHILAELYDSDRAHCESYLDRIATDLRKSNLKVRTAVLKGLVADSILDYAEDTLADLIVMSTHGRTGVERWLLGSVAEKIVRSAKMPALLVRPPMPVTSPQVAVDKIEAEQHELMEKM